MNYSEYEWEVSYDPDRKEDVIMIDNGDTVVYLTGPAMKEFLERVGDK